MPLRERWTYGDWSSDVTGYAERPTNRGRAEAAGVMPGACLVRQVLQRPQSGRVLQVEVRLRAMRCSRQGSRGPWLCYRWCWAHKPDESSDVQDALMMRPVAGLVERRVPVAGFPEGTDAAVRADSFGRSCPLWLCLGSGRYGCICVRYRYELGCCNRWNLAALCTVRLAETVLVTGFL
jgi:hypothetical protein